MLEEILKKESITIEDMVIINANLDKLSDSDLVRLGLKESTQEEVVVEKPKRAKKV